MPNRLERSMYGRLFAGWAVCFLFGCAGTNTPGWAVLDGDIVVAEDGIAGDHTWSFYKDAWEKKQGSEDAKHLICSIDFSFFGAPVEVLEECDECSEAYRIDGLSEISNDCEPGVGEGAGYSAMTHYLFGAVDPDVVPPDSAAETGFGWYVSWDGETVESVGIATGERSTWAAPAAFDLEAGVGWLLE